MNRLLIFIITLSFLSCSGKQSINHKEQNKADLREIEEQIEEEEKRDSLQNELEELTVTGTTENIYELEARIFYDGDINAYNTLRDEFMLERGSPESFIFWALHMANNYDYAQAYIDVYQCITFTYNDYGINYDKIDKKTKQMLIEYLQIAANKGIKQAQEILDEIKE